MIKHLLFKQLIPLSYYDHLPSRLPKTVILQGIDGGIWNVPMKLKQDEVFLGQGWSKFVRDNSLSDGEFLTFVYNGDSIFEVSIYRHDGCKEIKEVSEVDDDDEEDSVGSLSSEDTNTCSDSEMDNAIPRSKNKGFHTLLAFFHHLCRFYVIALHRQNCVVS